MKPFFGVLFRQGELVYVTQISHAQPRHEKMRNAPDFIKVYIPERNPSLPDRFVAVVNMNYMFPVHESLLWNLEYREIENHRTFSSAHEKSMYIDLLSKEMEQVNTMGVERKARKLYDLKIRHPYDRVAQRCLDFLELEKLAVEYAAQSVL